MLAELFVGLFLIWFSQYVLTTYLRRRNMPPGPLPYPFLGNIPHLLCDRVKPFAKLAEKYGDIYSVSFANIEAVVIGTYSLIREARIERKDDFVGRDPVGAYAAQELVEGGITVADFSPAHTFRKRVLKSGLHLFGPGIEKATKKATFAAGNVITEINLKQGRPFIPHNLLINATLANNWQWLTSKELNLNDPVINELAEFLDILFHQTSLSPLYYILPILMYLPERFTPERVRGRILKEKLFSTELEQHKKSYDSSVMRDLTDCFICSYEKEIAKEKKTDVGSEKDIVGLMVEVMTLGTDTTAKSVIWLLLYLVLYPNIQEKVHEELDLVIGRNRSPTWKDAEKMPYLQACLCEVQRASGFIPAVWTNARRDSTISGYSIRKGTFVALNLHRINQDEKVWPEPKKFKPERFFDSDGKFLGWDDVYGFIPFGLGRRQCPGQSLAKITMFTIASTLLHRYRFELPERAEIPSTELAAVSVAVGPQDFEIVAKERF